MFTATDRSFVIRWCHARAVPCALPASDDEPILLRHGNNGDGGWFRLAAEPGGFRLETDDRDILAAASDLPALLDALDAGIGRVPRARVSAA